jgi:hypothetical protein
MMEKKMKTAGEEVSWRLIAALIFTHDNKKRPILIRQPEKFNCAHSRPVIRGYNCGDSGEMARRRGNRNQNLVLDVSLQPLSPGGFFFIAAMQQSRK